MDGSRSTPRRNRPEAAHFSGCLPQAPLHRPDRRLLRVEGHEAPRAKQPYAIAMNDGSPFGLAGLWENWSAPATGEWNRTFVVVTTYATTWSPKSMTACR